MPLDYNDAAVFPFTAAEAMEFTRLVENSLKIMNYAGFADMDIIPPEIDFFNDMDQFYDSGRNLIHIGVPGIVTYFRPTDEEDYFSALNYIFGHEQQHRRSTAAKPYGIAIRMGCEAIVEYIQAQVESTRRKFRKAEDYAYFTDHVLPGLGIYVSWNMVHNIVGGIANSVEDGRIERIRSNRWHGFDMLRMVYRGRIWEQGGGNFPPYEELENNVPKRLQILTNQILSLATTQLFEKGFAAAYAGTPLMEEIHQFMQPVAEGVLAGRTRGLIQPVVAICRLLAPYIYETCKLSKENIEARKALEQLLADMLKSMIDSMPDEMPLDEREEDTDEGSLNSAFPVSDLVITLDDETYDKLKRNSRKSDNPSEGGVMIRREHPEKEESGENGEGASNPSGSAESTEADSRQNAPSEMGISTEDTKSPAGSESSDAAQGGNGQSDGQDAEDGTDSSAACGGVSRDAGSMQADQEGQEGQGAGTNDAAEKQAQPKGGTKGEKPDAEASPEGAVKGEQAGTQPEGAAKGEQAEAEQGRNEDEGTEGSGKKSPQIRRSDDAGASGAGKDEANKHVSKEIMTAAEKAVREAMKEATAMTRAEAEANIASVNTSISSTTRADKGKECIDSSKPVSSEEMKDICDFVEVKREYQVSDALPAVLLQRGKTLKRKNERYFKSLSKPSVSYLDSGSIDPSLIYSLGIGNTEIFRKEGKPYKADICAYMLIDNSGSMYGNKRTEACKAAAVVEEGFKSIMPLKIVAFDENGCIIHEVIKNWEESLNRNCCWNFCLHGRDGCGNEDAYDIQVAERELLARPEKKKLLLVLSDGAPGRTDLCHDAIAHARKMGIQVVGIYFEEGDCRSNETFERMYEKDFVCCPVHEIDENLEKIFKKFSRKV